MSDEVANAKIMIKVMSDEVMKMSDKSCEDE
jgi:hypothetical protein